MTAVPPEPVLPGFLVTGRDDIDTVHARLHESLSVLWLAIGTGDREEAMTRAMTLLFGLRADYACEEALMRQFDYPEIERHQGAHAVLEMHFNGITRRIRDAAAAFPVSERAELQAALRAAAGAMAMHVANADVPLVRFLESREVSGT